MKKTSTLLQAIILLLLSACSSFNEEMSSELSLIKDKWALDSRVALFDVDVKITGKVATVTGETTVVEAKQELMSWMKGKDYQVVDSFKVLPDAESEQKWAITTLSVANLRDMPKHSGQLVSQTILGTPVKVLKRESEWSLVQSPDHYIAWTNNSSLHFMNDLEFMQWRTSARVFVTRDCWLLDEQNNRVADLVKGSLVTNAAVEHGKVIIQLPDGRSGIVEANDIREFDALPEAPLLDANNLIREANTFMGLPYLWGGTSSKAVDCSGFLKNIYFMNGYILDRDASQQIEHGRSIQLNIDSLMAGDLLFFGNKASNRVTHVAMYIGDTEYIHSSGRVKINSLDSARDNYSNYRTSTWLGAQRYIGQEPGEGIMAVTRHPWYVVIN